MTDQLEPQRDFTAGQVDVSALRRDDSPIQRSALRQARNCRIMNTGPVEQRPGRRILFSTPGIVEKIRPATGEYWYMALEPGGVTFHGPDVADFVRFDSQPWTLQDLPRLRYIVSGGTVLIAWGGRFRQYAYNAVTRAWTYSLFTFAADQSGALRQPFYNFLPGLGRTLTPSARSGVINVTFSGPVLEPGHAGVIFRYVERQIRIDTVLSPTVASATVIEQLPPTIRLGVDNVAGVEVGDIVEALDSGCRGIVGRIFPSATPPTLDILVVKNWSGFIGGEKLIGPRSSSTVQGAAATPNQTFEAPLPSVQWDEALISDIRGWPRCVALDQQRVCLADLPQLGAGVVYSAVGSLNDFSVGTEADEAIFEILPENTQVYDIVGGADQFLFTDTGPYYIPISAANPLKPGSIEFRRISRDAAAPILPRETTEGIVYVNAGRSRVLVIVGTGQTTRPYVIEDLTEYHSDLIKSPKALAVSDSDVAAPERYLYAVNEDGTLAVARYERSQKIVGWVPWDGVGAVQWVTAGGPDVVVTVDYGGARYAEAFDDTLLIDGAVALTSPDGDAALTLESGAALTLESGDPLTFGDIFIFGWAEGLTMAAVQNDWFRGLVEIGENGAFSEPIGVDSVAGLFVGFPYEVVVEPFVPHAGGGQGRRQRMRRRKISQAAAVLQQTQAVQIGGRLVPYYVGDENQELPPPIRDTVERIRPFGRDFDPRWSVVQTLPGRLRVLELTTEVTI